MIPAPPTALAARVRLILRTKNLSLAEASRNSFLRFPANPRCRIPRNLYNRLATTDLRPDLFQLYALSVISGYRLADWLAVFGFPLDELVRVNMFLPSTRTTLLDIAALDDQAWMPWFSEGPQPAASISPLSQLLHAEELRRMGHLPGQPSGRFLYLRVGRRDAFAFPELLPGSIIRADTRNPERFLPGHTGEMSRVLFLVEHRKGFTCCRLRRSGKKRVTLYSAEIPYATVGCELGGELRILGVVDLEIRRLDAHQPPEVTPEFRRFWQPSPLPPAGECPAFAALLKTSRARSSLSLREAAARTRKIAEVLRDSRFAIPASSLAAYEKSDRPPRDIFRTVSLLILYFIEFRTLLESAGLSPEKAGREAIPEDLQPRACSHLRLSRQAGPTALHPGGFLVGVLAQLEEFPYGLARTYREVTGLADLSLRDIFWVGGTRLSFHPYLHRALFVILNRHKKRPRESPLRPPWQQPLYLLVLRDGAYLLGRCGADGDYLTVHPFSDGFSEPRRLRNRIDAEVVGEVAVIIRRIVPNT